MFFITRVSSSLRRPLRIYPLIKLGISGGTILSGGLAFQNLGDRDSLPITPATTDKESFSALLRSFIVYSLVSIPSLVDASPALFSSLTSIPVLRQITESFVRATIFSQFVGGDSVEDTLPLARRLRAEHKGVLLSYSVETDEAEAYEKFDLSPRNRRSVVDEILRCIDVAADFEDNATESETGDRMTWVAVKMTALVPHTQSLINLSSYLLATRTRPHHSLPFPGIAESNDLSAIVESFTSKQPIAPLSHEDLAELRYLYSNLVRICQRAQERGVKLIVDAEHSWFQPAIEAYTLSLMERFNKLPSRSFFQSVFVSADSGKVQPLIYGTYQAYLRRTPGQLALSLEHAKAHRYSLGIKLVRGAYHPYEVEAHVVGRGLGPSISPDAEPPVWLTKAETDECYDACVRVLLRRVREDVASNRGRPGIGILFATHNWKSCQLILDCLVKEGLARVGADGAKVIGEEVTKRITIGQLYGMRDTLTNHIVEGTRSRSPFVIKLIPYGTLLEVMPYLSRRAIENKTLLGAGGAKEERRLAWGQIKGRLFGWA